MTFIPVIYSAGGIFSVEQAELSVAGEKPIQHRLDD
jgi:hypothetical protein